MVKFKGYNRSAETKSSEKSEEIKKEINEIFKGIEPIFKSDGQIGRLLGEQRSNKEKEINTVETEIDKVKNEKVDELKDKKELIGEALADAEEISKIYEKELELKEERENLAEEKASLEEKLKKQEQDKAAQEASETKKKIGEVSAAIFGKEKEIYGELAKQHSAEKALNEVEKKLGIVRLSNNVKEIKDEVDRLQKDLEETSYKIDISENGRVLLAKYTNELAEIDRKTKEAKNIESTIRQNIERGIREAAKELQGGKILADTAKNEKDLNNSIEKGEIFNNIKPLFNKLNEAVTIIENDSDLADKQFKKGRAELAITLPERVRGRIGRGAREAGLGVKSSADIAEERIDALEGAIDKFTRADEWAWIGRNLYLVAADGEMARIARGKMAKRDNTPYVNARNEFISAKAEGLANDLIAGISPKNRNGTGSNASAGVSVAAPGAHTAGGSSAAIENTITQSTADDYKNAEWANDAAREKFITENKQIINSFGYMNVAFNSILSKDIKDAFNSGNLTAQQAVIVYRTLSKVWRHEHVGIFDGIAKGHLLTDAEIDSMPVEMVDLRHSKAIYAYANGISDSAVLLAVADSDILKYTRRRREDYLARAMRTENKTDLNPASPEANKAKVGMHPGVSPVMLRTENTSNKDGKKDDKSSDANDTKNGNPKGGKGNGNGNKASGNGEKKKYVGVASVDSNGNSDTGGVAIGDIGLSKVDDKGRITSALPRRKRGGNGSKGEGAGASTTGNADETESKGAGTPAATTATAPTNTAQSEPYTIIALPEGSKTISFDEAKKIAEENGGHIITNHEYNAGLAPEKDLSAGSTFYINNNDGKSGYPLTADGKGGTRAPQSGTTRKIGANVIVFVKDKKGNDEKQ